MIPEMSKEVAPRILPTGEEAPRIGGAIGAISVMEPSVARAGAVEVAMQEVDLLPSIPNLNWELPPGVELTKKDERLIKIASGKASYQLMGEAISDPTWASLDKETRKLILQNIRRQAFAMVRDVSKGILANPSGRPDTTGLPDYLVNLIDQLGRQ